MHVVQERKKFEFVEAILNFTQSWVSYYRKGAAVATEQEEYMTDLKDRVGKTRDNFSATSEKFEGLKEKMLSSAQDPGLLNKMYTRWEPGGYQGVQWTQTIDKVHMPISRCTISQWEDQWEDQEDIPGTLCVKCQSRCQGMNFRTHEKVWIWASDDSSLSVGAKGSLTNKKPGWGVTDQSEGIKPVGVSEPWPESNELFCDVLFVSGLRLQLTADMSCLMIQSFYRLYIWCLW